MASAMAVEARGQLKIFGDAAVQGGLSELETQLQATALNEEAEWYNDDPNFESAVGSAMKAKRHVLADVERLSMAAPSVDLSDWSLAEPGRMDKLVSWLRAGPAATEVRRALNVRPG